MSSVDWQLAARAAQSRRIQQPFYVWIAGPVDVSVGGDSFRECVYELQVSRPSELPFTHADTGLPVRALRAIVDTGCTDTSIRADLAAELGLPPIGITEVYTGSTGDEAIQCQTVLADLRLIDAKGSVILIRHALTALDMSDDMLLGMDLMGGGVLTVDLVDGVWGWRYFVPTSPPRSDAIPPLTAPEQPS